MNEKLLEFVERHYFFELERKDRLNQTSTIPLGLSAILVALVGYSIKIASPIAMINALSFICTGLSVIMLLLFYVSAARFFLGPGYLHIRSQNEFLEYRKELSAHKAQFPAAQSVKATFQNSLAESYARSASHNQLENHRKSAWLYRMNKSLVWGFGFGSVAAGVKLV